MICLVLSVGGPKGIAHLGAIDALRDRNIKIAAVYGNSMGAVMGGFYAAQPHADIRERWTACMTEYIRVTKKEKVGSAAALGGLAALLSGGALAPVLIGGAAGAGIVREIDLERFRQVFDASVQHASIEELPIRFATSSQYREGEGLRFEMARTGNLAEAVTRSANNPFIFNTDVRSASYIDPGADRVASVPIEDAYATFDPTHIIAINVTGSPAFFSRNNRCIIKEISVHLANVKFDAIMGSGPEFSRVYSAGYSTVWDALEAGGTRTSASDNPHPSRSGQY
jgi:NTE family protein